MHVKCGKDEDNICHTYSTRTTTVRDYSGEMRIEFQELEGCSGANLPTTLPHAINLARSPPRFWLNSENVITAPTADQTGAVTCYFSLRCKSTLQRCPKKVTVIIYLILPSHGKPREGVQACYTFLNQNCRETTKIWTT